MSSSTSSFAIASEQQPLTTRIGAESISPALLTRARASARKHDELSTKLIKAYDTSLAKQVGELSPVASAVRDWDHASDSLKELSALLEDPSTDKELRDIAEEDFDTSKTRLLAASQTLTAALVPHHPFADLPCLLEIRPGVGGAEAALFAGDLVRMYQAYCASQGLRSTLLKYEDIEGTSDPNGSDSPLREAIIDVSTPGAYERLRTEAGVHRVQRVPATESKGRTHTSVASVLVLPSLPSDDAGESGPNDFNDPNSDYYVSSAEVRVDTMRARGAGGQHVNTTDSAVRLTHIPTNTVVAVQDERSQLKNRAKAWRILRGRIAQQKREAREEEMLRMRRNSAGHGKSGRADKIRTYNWGQQRVTDHRSGLTINQLDSVIDGGEALETIMESVRKWMREEEIQDLIVNAESG